MNNCLVTKLKTSVNNEDLSKLNVLTIKTKAVDSPTVNTQWFGVGASENGSVSINSSSVGLYQSGISGELKPYPVNVPANGYTESHFENKDGIIEVTGKYNISDIVVGSSGIVRAREIYGIPSTIKRLVINNFEENEIDATKLNNTIDHSKFSELIYKNESGALNTINKLNKNTIREFTSCKTINGAFASLFDGLGLNDLANNVSLSTITFYQINAGNLSSLAKLTNLTRIMFLNSKQNSGDIMDFINPWIQAGRTNGKIEVNWLLGQKNITLNGQPITYPEGVSSSNAYLNWTSDGTVTFTAS